MKKSLVTLLSVLLATQLQASDTKKAQLKSTMSSMLSSMELIQRGGFYSRPEMMKQGVIKLKKAVQLFDATNAKNYLPKEQKYADKFATKRAKMITMYANDITASLDTNNMDDALEDYTQIIKQCTSCHLRIRKW